MSATAFDAIPTAVAGALRTWPAVTALAGQRVYVNRGQALPAQRVNGINVRVEQAEQIQPLTGSGVLAWRTALQLECYSRSPVGGNAAEACNQLLQAVWQCLANHAVHDALRPIGVQALDIDPVISWEPFDEGDAPICCAVLRTTVRHLTRSNSLSTFEIPA